MNDQLIKIKNVQKINDSVKSIEFLTKQFRKKRLTTETYIKLVHEKLSNLTDEKNYLEYLKNLDQN